MKKRRIKITMNIGIISFMVIFIILSLVTFAILSIVSAKSNMRDAESYATHASYYYTLDTMANEELEKIDTQLAANAKNSTSAKDYFAQLSHVKAINDNITIKDHQISYTLTYREAKMDVTLTALYNAKTYYKIDVWKTTSSALGNSGQVNIYPDTEKSGTIEVWGSNE